MDELIIPGKVHIICACCNEATFPYARIDDGPLEGHWVCKPCCEDSKPCRDDIDESAADNGAGADTAEPAVEGAAPSTAGVDGESHARRPHPIDSLVSPALRSRLADLDPLLNLDRAARLIRQHRAGGRSAA